jgi:hypothetical protein
MTIPAVNSHYIMAHTIQLLLITLSAKGNNISEETRPPLQHGKSLKYHNFPKTSNTVTKVTMQVFFFYANESLLKIPHI